MSTPSTKSESGMLPGTDSDENALRVACVTGGVCAVLIVVATVYLNMYADQRVMLTTVGVFSDWRSLRNIFVETVSYEPHFNLPELDYYSDFETAVSSLSVLRDLYQRKLISQGMFANASLLFNLTTGARIVGGGDPARLMQLIAAFFSKFTANSTLPPRVYEIVTAAASPQDQRILSRLMSVSGCSYPDAMPGKTPWNRSPGCHCIGDAYVSFIKATWNTSRNVTVGARDAAADDVLRCLDRRVTSHSWVAGADWTIHPLAVVLFLNCVVFLVCVAFVLTYHAAQMPEHVISDPVWRLRAVKGLLLLITGAFALLFALHDLMANIFLLVGLSLTLGSLTISAQSVLFQFIATAGVRSPGRCTAHPLLVCFWLNVPQIVPALVVLVAVSGYTRDVYAVWAVAGIGAIMGSLLQRLFWILWYGYDSVMSLIVPPLLFAFFDLTVLILLLLISYRTDLEVYAMSGSLAIMGFVLYVFALLGLLRYEYHVHRVRKERGSLMDQIFENDRHSPLFLVTAATLVWVTVVGIVDAHK